MPSLDELLKEIADDLREQGAKDRADAINVARLNIREAPRRNAETVEAAMEELEILRGAAHDAYQALQGLQTTTGAAVVDGKNHWMYEGGTQSA